MRSRYRFPLSFCLSWILAAGTSSAALFVPNLPAGSFYHLAFLTDGTRHAIDELNEAYDAFVMADAAKNADLADIEFRALGTTIHLDAATHVDVTAAVYRLDGVRIAARETDLWDGTIEAPLNVTPGGVKNKDVSVWTGAGRNGKNATCVAFGVNRECYLGNPDPNSHVMAGKSSATDSTWITGDERKWTEQNAMYAISERLTVPAVVVPGDVDGNGLVNATDIDLTGNAVRTSSTDLKFDHDKSGAVNNADSNYLVGTILNTWVGDSNLDGVFSSSDFVAIFAIGEYEDAIVGNSGWADGDWNLDKDFNTTDMVFAFQQGGFELGPRSAVSAVPEPASLLSVAFGLGGVTLFGRRRAGR